MRMFFIGSDDLPAEAKLEATRAINEALKAGWRGLAIAARFSLDEIGQGTRVRRAPERVRTRRSRDLTRRTIVGRSR